MKYAQMVSMPSAVSDWLVGELEARGIDAVLYTRYVLSLLHSHPVDLIYQDDLQHSHLRKEVGKSNGGRKRSRKSSSDWWRYAQADAEQIKRSAAVQCLVSASDQNCEIESLVDELCDKLKEVESEASTPTTELAEAQPEVRKLTPQELAEKYYAAFPALLPMIPRSPETSRAKPASSPEKPAASPAKKRSARKMASRISYETKLHAKENIELKARSQNKRLTCFARNKNMMPRITSFNPLDVTISNRKIGAAAKMKSSPEKDQCLEEVDGAWSTPLDLNIYEDLTVNIKHLLESPSPTNDNIEKISMANMRNVGNPQYIAYGTSSRSSIWSTNCTGSNDPIWSNDNAAKSFKPDNNSNDYGLDSKFSSISIDTRSKPINQWLKLDIPTEEGETHVFEDAQCGKLYFGEYSCFPNTNHWRKAPSEKMEDDDEKRSRGDEKPLDRYAYSLLKINHDREASGFARVAPRSNQSNSFNTLNRPLRSSRRRLNFDKEEDLLTSEKSHFKPINEKLDNSYSHYADGATFVISNKLDKVDFTRSASGTLWLTNDQGQRKKYLEYKEDEITSLNSKFVIKFLVCQNDKACQTDLLPHLDFDTDEDKADAEEDTAQLLYFSPEPKPVDHCTCPNDKKPAMETDNSTICPLHPARPESALGEVLWKYEMKMCEKCNNNSYTSSSDWSSKGQTDSDWDDQGLRDIWSGEEVCQACSTGGGVPRPTANLQLREDIIQDGEQLFSDLRTVQRSYMEGLPADEPSCDIAELASVAASTSPPKERKRRHSFILEQRPSAWSFASRLEENCVIQMSTLPTLRSVTL